MLLGVGSHSPGVIKGPSVANTDPRLVRLKFIGLQKTHIIRCHDGATVTGCEVHSGMQIALFVGSTRSLQLKVKTIRKAVLPALDRRSGVVLSPVEQCLTNVTPSASRERNHSLGIFCDPVLFDSGSTQILPLLVGPRQKQHQVSIPSFVLSEKAQFMVTSLI